MDSAAARTAADLPVRFNAAADLIAPNLAAGRGGKTAIIDRGGEISYATLAERIDRAATMFAGLGVGPGERVLMAMVDSADFVAVFLGAVKAGIVPVPLNTLLTSDDYRWMVQDSGASAVVVSDEIAERWTPVAAACPDVRFISDRVGPWPRLNALLAAAAPRAETAPTRRDDIAFWLYTSGSTGRPKAAMHRHASLRLTANLHGLGTLGYRADDVVLSVAKLFFAYGLGNALSFPLAAGATVVLNAPRATPEAISALMIRHRVSILNGVPTFFASWLASDAAPSAAEIQALRLATSAGECLPAHLGERFRAHYGADIVDGLGSTEMLHVYLSQRPGAVRYGCTGRPVDGYDIRLVDEYGRPVADGVQGELQVRGPSAAAGYWNNAAKTRETFLGGWTRTGDSYARDADGWFTYGGRRDDMLKVGGIYVSPFEIEDALARHPEVVEAAVVGRADEDGLIKPCAHVVLKAGRGDARIEAALKAHVKAELAPYKYPRWFRFPAALPKTASGKIQRYRLREGE
jgi:benzoate-CoA ligase